MFNSLTGVKMNLELDDIEEYSYYTKDDIEETDDWIYEYPYCRIRPNMQYFDLVKNCLGYESWRSSYHCYLGWDFNFKDEMLNWYKKSGDWTIRIQQNDHPIFSSRPIPPGQFITLFYKDEIMMSDTPAEIYDLKKCIDKTLKHGYKSALIGGLGLSLHATLLNGCPTINTIDIVEIDEDIIKLNKSIIYEMNDECGINGHVRKENGDSIMNVIKGDVFEYQPTRKYDLIWLDIWLKISSDNLEEMKKLKDKYKPFLNKGGYIACWCEKECSEGV
jgi:hypothetical protein